MSAAGRQLERLHEKAVVEVKTWERTKPTRLCRMRFWKAQEYVNPKWRELIAFCWRWDSPLASLTSPFGSFFTLTASFLGGQPDLAAFFLVALPLALREGHAKNPFARWGRAAASSMMGRSTLRQHTPFSHVLGDCGADDDRSALVTSICA